MRFQIGDLIRHDGFGIGTVVECDDLDETLLVRFEDRALWVHESDCTAEGTLRFSLGEPPNFIERSAWIDPVWGPADDDVCSFLSGVYIGRFPAPQDHELSSVTPTPLTVEADGDVAITCDLPHYPWQRFGGPGHWDNTFIDGVWRAKWYLTEHGTLSHVQVGEVTL